MHKLRAVFVVFLLAGCGFNKGAANQMEDQREEMSPSTPEPGLRFLALGDSYTIGEGVTPSDRWPVQLARLMRDQGVPMGEPKIIAKTGWTTGELMTGIDRASPGGSVDLVSLLIGVNDQYRGRNDLEYRREFAGLLGRAIQFVGGDPSRVVVLSIPDWGVTPFAAGRDRAGISGEIDRFNAINREETTRLGSHYVDITASSRKVENDLSLLAADGLHPSAKMYREWAELCFPIVRERFARLIKPR